MAASKIHYDGVCRRRLIRAILGEAEKRGKRRPSQAEIGAVLGVSEHTVWYHMRKIRKGSQ